jgi:mannose-6-phosphate isomerase-like protein (cupin superfamily)
MKRRKINMQIYRPRDFTGARAWDSLDIERIEGATVRLHWTDQAYIWHENDGPEVFVVLSGSVDMHVLGQEGETVHRLVQGDIFHAQVGDQHKAVPVGEARILVVERAGSF